VRTLPGGMVITAYIDTLSDVAAPAKKMLKVPSAPAQTQVAPASVNEETAAAPKVNLWAHLEDADNRESGASL
jgi:hypothetical protein